MSWASGSEMQTEIRKFQFGTLQIMRPSIGIVWQSKWYSKNKTLIDLQSTDQRNKLYPLHGPSTLSRNTHAVAKTSRQILGYSSGGIFERNPGCGEMVLLSRSFHKFVALLVASSKPVVHEHAFRDPTVDFIYAASFVIIVSVKRQFVRGYK
jgi:hypothetical protein